MDSRSLSSIESPEHHFVPAHFAAATLLFKYKQAKEDSALERLRTLQQTTSEERAKADKGYLNLAVDTLTFMGSESKGGATESSDGLPF